MYGTLWYPTSQDSGGPSGPFLDSGIQGERVAVEVEELTSLTALWYPTSQDLGSPSGPFPESEIRVEGLRLRWEKLIFFTAHYGIQPPKTWEASSPSFEPGI